MQPNPMSNRLRLSLAAFGTSKDRFANVALIQDGLTIAFMDLENEEIQRLAFVPRLKNRRQQLIRMFFNYLTAENASYSETVKCPAIRAKQFQPDTMNVNKILNSPVCDIDGKVLKVDLTKLNETTLGVNQNG